jgi:transcriptional regulator with XRE-family HTH domain
VAARPRKEPDTKTFSGRLAKQVRDLRDSRGLSAEELAQKIRTAGYAVSISTIYHWENGTRQIPVDALPAIAKALRVNLIDLFPRLLIKETQHDVVLTEDQLRELLAYLRKLFCQCCHGTGLDAESLNGLCGYCSEEPF